MKIQKRIETLSAVLFAALGLLAIFLPVEAVHLLIPLAALLMLGVSLIFLIHGVERKRGLDLAAACILCLFGILCLYANHHSVQILIIAFGLYYCACAAVMLIQSVLDVKSRYADWPADLLLCLLFSLLGIGSFVFIREDIRLVQLFMGSYLLVQALQVIVERFFFQSPYNARYYAFRNWLCLPSYIVGILPSVVYMLLISSKMRNTPTRFDIRKSDEPADLSVFIHTGTYGSKLYGRMTFSRNGVAYSYGDYDRAAEKLLHTIGPGTFFTVGSEIYSNNCSIVEDSPQFEYGLRLNDQQKEKFDQMVQNILDHTDPWKCDLQKLPMDETEEKFPEYEDDYACRLWYRTGCEFRQYRQGEWAWYSLLGNNCSNFAAAKLNEIGLQIPVSRSIVSPGEFFEYFEEALQDPDSPVISRSWHSAAVPATLFDTID